MTFCTSTRKCVILLLSALISHSLAASKPPPSPIRAVNLGAWLVTEGWMTPWLFDDIKNKDLLDGTQVQLKSVARQKYLAAENGGGAAIVANRPTASGWESFMLYRTQDSTFQFKVFNNQFIGLDGQGGIIATSSFSDGETFEIIRNSNNRVRIRASNGRFILAKNDGSVAAQASENSNWDDQDPSVFEMAIVPGTTKQGEYQLTNGYGIQNATKKLRVYKPLKIKIFHTVRMDAIMDLTDFKMQEHWNSYIVEDDFAFMSQNGINAVRIPVGYWIIKDNPPLPFVGGSLQMLDKAFGWAEKHNIGVIVDLHAAPGSQNGNDHSGTRDGSQNWGKSDENIQQTVAVIDFLTSRYAKRSGLLAMELINEPLAPGVEINRLKQYYQAGYDAVRKYSNCYVVFSNRLGPHDGTELLDFASMLDNTVIDVHYYNLYDSQFTNKNLQQNIDYVYNDRAADINYLSRSNGPLLFIGEWTAALAQSNDDEARAFGKAQLDVFGRASFGWAFWSYKNNSPQWSMKILKLK